MKPETYTALLKALQKIEKRIVAESVKRARGPLKAQVQRLHTAAETGGRLDDYVKVLAGRSATQFLLRTVYVRVLEDLGLLDPPAIRGQRGRQAFRDVAPGLGVRDYFAWVFRDLGVDFPDLFAIREDELPLPSEELCAEVWALWHVEDGAGGLLYAWDAGDFESRFLGDLYQDLDADVRKRYALLQTPDFVEAYILDHTLTPALVEFDPATLRDRGETFRLIDPTCGSGHFLIGAFHRLAAYWEGRGLDAWEAAQRALESVWGWRTGVQDLERLAGLTLNLRALDSLIPWEGLKGQMELAGMDRLSTYATAEERAANAVFLGRDFHVVVGNPPYVTPKDPRKRDDYRVFWPESATGKYGLAAPFVERLFSLGCERARMGQITGNAFIKRSYGVSLIENVLPEWDLRDVVDTSGAYIPGHGTPTVVLFGRCQAPVSRKIRVVGGKRGEPRAPENPANGKVWRAIVDASDVPDDSSPFVTVSVYGRVHYGTHPWNVNGGGAPELQRRIEASSELVAGVLCEEVGPGGITGQDEVLAGTRSSFGRLGVERHALAELHPGDAVRDYHVARSGTMTLFSYEVVDGLPRRTESFQGLNTVCWRFRGPLLRRPIKGFKRITHDPEAPYRLSFFYPSRFASEWLLPFAFVATHNHFVLDRGGKVFKQSAPVIKLKPDATLEDHLDLLGLLNSSTLGFWMKQVFFDKGNGGIGGGIANEEWERFFEFDSTKLQRAPITDGDRAPRIALARALDHSAQQRAARLPAARLGGDDWTPGDLADHLEADRAAYRHLTAEMCALQEELDWLTYGSYGLLEGHTVLDADAITPLAPGHRPFEIVLARHNATCDPDERSAWFARHGREDAETTTVPQRPPWPDAEPYPEALRELLRERLDLIERHREIRLIEQPQFKRRWQTPDLEAEAVTAARDWLLDRLEDLFAPAGDDAEGNARPAGPLTQARPYRLEEIVNAWREDPRVQAVARVYRQTREPVDLSLVAEELLRAEGLPDNIFRLYTDEGLRKLRQWQEVWRLQDREDAGEEVRIPPPPELKKGDFQEERAFKIRGKLNVPRERFILFADLFPTRYGWNGWRDLDRGLAQVAAFELAENDPETPLPAPSPEDPRRCGVTVGLWESLDDIRRWASAHQASELGGLAREVCGQQSCPCDVAKSWQQWKAGKLQITSATQQDQAATVEERAELLRLIQRLDPRLALVASSATHKAIETAWPGDPARLDLVLEDLIASGDLTESGRGTRRKYTLRG
jgi:hypothetical protein